MKHVYVLLIVVATVSEGFAQLRLENLEQCLEQVRLHNPALKNETLNQEISRERVRAAWALMLPQLKAFGSLDNNLSLPVQLIPGELIGGQEGEYSEIQFGTQYNVSYGAEASLSLVNVANWKNVKSASYSEKATRFQQQYQEQAILEQAVTAYYFALLSHEASLLNFELVKANDSLLQVADVRARNGFIEPLEFNRVKSMYLESQYQLRESEGFYRKNISALKAFMGVAQKDSVILTEHIAHTIDSKKETAVLSASVNNTARYNSGSLRVLQTEQDWKRQRVRVFPELSVFARYTRTTYSDQMDFYKGTQPWYDAAVVGLRAEWNLFTGFNRQASIRQSSLQSKMARQDLENSTLQIQKELDELTTNHEVAAYGLARYAEHFQLNRTNYEVATEKYNQGIYSLDQFITVYQEMVRSQNQYLAKLANYVVYDSIIKIKNEYQVK